MTITFNKPVTGLGSEDLDVDAAGTLSPLTSSDDGLTWTATFTPSPGATAATNLITLDNSGVTDAAAKPAWVTVLRATSRSTPLRRPRPWP